MASWTLEDGLKLVRAIQGGCRLFGYHLTLGGGVLNKGQSDKDLDLYFLPLNNEKYKEDPKGLVAWLESLWGNGKAIGDYGKRNNPYDPPEPLNAAPQYRVRYDVNGNIDGIERIPDVDPFTQEPIDLSIPATPITPAGNTVYKYKLKFTRPGGDRIDAFVL